MENQQTQIQIPEHKRAIPVTKKFISNLKVNARIYGYLVKNSSWDAKLNHRYVKARGLDTRIANDLKISRTTTQRALKSLINSGNIEYLKNYRETGENYYIIPIPLENFELIKVNILEKIVHYFAQPNILKIYVILMSKWSYKQNKNLNTPIYFTIKELALRLGYAENTAITNNKVRKEIKEILAILVNCGLIEVQAVNLITSTQQVYPVLELTNMGDDIIIPQEIKSFEEALKQTKEPEITLTAEDELELLVQEGMMMAQKNFK